MRLNLFIVVLILLIQTCAAVEIKDFRTQISNAEYEVNETKAELSTAETNSNIYFLNVKDLRALSAELEYLRDQFKKMEYASYDNEEMRTRLYELYLEALEIEFKAKMMRSDINIAKAEKLISLAQVKVEAAKQISLPTDVNLQTSQASLYEALRFKSQAENITLILPEFSTESAIKKLIRSADEVLSLSQSSIKEVTKSIAYADGVLNKSLAVRNLSAIKLMDLDENISKMNVSITALISKDISAAQAQSSLNEGVKLRNEANELFNNGRYEETQAKITASEYILQQTIQLVDQAEYEDRSYQTKKNMIAGIAAFSVVGIFLWYIRRPPQL
ncbi:MAG: hypothetical protein OIN66_08735 [Candidatus Methanoperedens sp.]|nr:hypothetical protein [Candidatus Methanoperedens sp.]